jgi:hypothetical protein
MKDICLEIRIKSILRLHYATNLSTKIKILFIGTIKKNRTLVKDK